MHNGTYRWSGRSSAGLDSCVWRLTRVSLSPAPFVCIGHLYFQSLTDFQNGMLAHGEDLLADVPNYTDLTPQIQVSEVVGT